MMSGFPSARAVISEGTRAAFLNSVTLHMDTSAHLSRCSRQPDPQSPLACCGGDAGEYPSAMRGSDARREAMMHQGFRGDGRAGPAEESVTPFSLVLVSNEAGRYKIIFRWNKDR